MYLCNHKEPHITCDCHLRSFLHVENILNNYGWSTQLCGCSDDMLHIIRYMVFEIAATSTTLVKETFMPAVCFCIFLLFLQDWLWSCDIQSNGCVLYAWTYDTLNQRMKVLQGCAVKVQTGCLFSQDWLLVDFLWSWEYR